MPDKKGKSCYQRHNKRPYRYSDTYRNWFKAIISGDIDNAIRYSEIHAKQFGYKI